MIAALQQEKREQASTISQFLSSGIDLSGDAANESGAATGSGSSSSSAADAMSASLMYIELKRKQQEGAKSQEEAAAKFTFAGPKPKATAQSALLSHIEATGLASVAAAQHQAHTSYHHAQQQQQQQHVNRKKAPRAAASARPKLQAAKKQRGADYADKLTARVVSKKSKLK